MKNLDERLQTAKRIAVSETDIFEAKQKIIQHKKHKFNRMPLFVTATMFAIMCILMFLPTSKVDQNAASTVINKEIEEIIYLHNKQPYFNHDPNSLNYLLAVNKVKDKEAIKVFQTMLAEVVQQPESWTQEAAGFDTYEVALNFTDGTSQRLKVDLFIEDGSYIYDVTNNLQYETDKASDLYEWFYENEQMFNFWPFMITVLIFVTALAVPNQIYRKKYGVLDEKGKLKHLSGWKHYLPYLIFMVPLFMLGTIFGTVHIGIAVILFISYVAITSHLEIREGVVQKNNIYMKIVLPLYILSFSVGLVLMMIF